MNKLLVSLLAATALAGCATASAPKANAVAAQTAPAPKPAYGSFGFDTAGMDKSVTPGNDFYEYADGTWAKNTPIPSAERVASVRNQDAWYAAFDPKPGEKLYLTPDQRVRIW